MKNNVPTEAELIILGMLYEKSRHGYDLDKLIELRGVRNWANIGFSSVYYILEKLENKGYVRSDGSTGKNRKNYSITKLGITVCNENTEHLLAHRISSKDPFMVGLANSHMLPEDEVSKSLLSRREQLKIQLDSLEKVRKSQGPLPKHAGYL